MAGLNIGDAADARVPGVKPAQAYIPPTLEELGKVHFIGMGI